MKHSVYLRLCGTSLLLVSCHPTTGHNLNYAAPPDTNAAGELAQIEYQVTAPDAWKPLRSRLGNPQLQYSPSPTFDEERSQKCQVSADGGALLMRCQLPTDGFEPGTVIYYRIAYTFDGNRETPLVAKELSVLANLSEATPYEKYEHLSETGASLENAIGILGEPTRESSSAYIWEFEDGSAIEIGKRGGTAYYGSGVPE